MKKQIESIAAQYQQARLRLVEAIKKLPDSAEGVKMLGPGCASVPFSLIAKANNFSPRYWLTRETKAELTKLVENNISIESLVRIVDTVITTGELKDRTKLPPNVIEALRKAWEG
jgi:hypothetical protein